MNISKQLEMETEIVGGCSSDVAELSRDLKRMLKVQVKEFMHLMDDQEEQLKNKKANSVSSCVTTSGVSSSRHLA
jgi:hypothetical protein